jgi:hypothetical protein
VTVGEELKAILSGAGTVLQLMPTPQPLMARPDFMRVSDGDRIASDWERVGSHLDRAMQAVEPEVREHGATK